MNKQTDHQPTAVVSVPVHYDGTGDFHNTDPRRQMRLWQAHATVAAINGALAPRLDGI